MSHIEDFFVREMIDGELGPRRPLAESDILNLDPLEIRGGLALYKIEKTAIELDTDEEIDEVVEVVRPECGTCRFYRHFSSGEQPFDGQCRRYPPKIVSREDEWQPQTHSFPEVYVLSWCGEYQHESPLWKPSAEVR